MAMKEEHKSAISIALQKSKCSPTAAGSIVNLIETLLVAGVDIADQVEEWLEDLNPPAPAPPPTPAPTPTPTPNS